MRRLLGYVVKLPDGTRSPLTPKPVPVIGDAVDAWIGAPDGSCVCPVFATRKPKPAPAEVARREGAEAARLDALLSIRDACEFKADTVSDEAAMGLRMAMLLVDRALTKTAEEAAKGQAK